MLYAMDVQGRSPLPLPPMADRHCMETKPKEEREMELVEFKVWGVTSLQAAEHETKPSSCLVRLFKGISLPIQPS